MRGKHNHAATGRGGSHRAYALSPKRKQQDYRQLHRGSSAGYLQTGRPSLIRRRSETSG